MSAPAFTLYRLDGACSLVPHAILTHFNVPFRTVAMVPGSDPGDAGAPGLGLRAADGSLSHEEYLEINPTGYVPALVVHGANGDTTDTVITEMPAVLTYIDSLIPQAHLLGSSPVQRAKVYECLAWLSGTLHATGYGAFWRPARFAATEEGREQVEVKGRAIIDRSYARIEDRLTGKRFAAGDELTAADFNLYIFWLWGNKIGVSIEKQYPSYARLMKVVEGLQGVKEARKVEKL